LDLLLYRSVLFFSFPIVQVFVWQHFLLWNQISYFKYHVYSCLIIEMKSERC
jgi:hypothetical protein